MALNVEKVPGRAFRISLNDDAVTCLKTGCFHEIVRVGLIRASAATRVGLHFCFSGLSVMDQTECPSLERKEGKPILENQYESLLLFLGSYFL